MADLSVRPVAFPAVVIVALLALAGLAALWAFPGEARAQSDTTPPTLSSATVNAAGTQISLVFDENLASATPGASAFSVTAAGSTVTVGGTSLSGATLSLTGLSPVIKVGQVVVVSYMDPTTGDDTVALQDATGNDVTSFTTGQGGVPAVTNNSTVAATPTVAGVEITSDPNDDMRDGDDDTYAIGEAIQVTVTFSTAVDVTGTPQLELDIGGSAKQADYASGTGTTALVFSYRVAQNNADTNGIAIGANKLDLNSGTIQQAGGTTAAKPEPQRGGRRQRPQGGRRAPGVRERRDVDRRHENHLDVQ